MKCVNVNEANLAELLKALEDDPEEEIFLTNGNKKKFKLIPAEEEVQSEPKIPREKLFGYGKGKLNLPPDFDEVFDELDRELWK